MILLAWTPEQLERRQAAAWQSFVSYGASTRRMISREYAELHATALEATSRPVPVVPDYVYAPGEYEAIKTGNFRFKNLWP